MARPLCFVLMPFGQKPADAGALIDFNAVYHNLIKPAIEEAGLELLRALPYLLGEDVTTTGSDRDGAGAARACAQPRRSRR